MPQGYADDLRRKFLEAYDQGRGGLEKLAALFGVSYGWAQKIVAARRRTGRAERPPGARRGRVSRLTPQLRSALSAQLQIQPDATLAELQRWLYEKHAVAVSVARLCRVLQELGLRLKKSRSTPPSRTRQPGARGANSGGGKSRESTPNA
jgi:transposase